MTPERQRLILVWLCRVCLVAAAGMGAFAFVKLPPAAPPPAAAGVPPAQFDPAPHISAEAWGVYAPGKNATIGMNSSNEPPHRFRLAGTFFTLGDGTNDARRAILDDTKTKQQSIVGMGEQVDGWTVTEVGAESALLVRGGERELLRLGFAGPKTAASVSVATNAVALDQGEKVLEESAFGKRVGDTRWVLSRAALLDYYQQLLDNPERVAALYVSLKPDYKGDEVAGYRLNQEGEQDFFKAMGLQEGDVVRRVNSMNMTSQTRAEYFIGEFVKDRLGAVVIDIERSGTPQKMIYLMR